MDYLNLDHFIGKIKKQNNELFIEFFADLTQLDYATVLVGGDKN